MNNLLVVLFLACIDLLPQIYSHRHKKEENNMCREVNVHIQNTVNQIFTLLQLNKNFTREFNNKLQLSMHAAMKTIAERNCKSHRSIEDAAKSFSDRTHLPGTFVLAKLINIVVQDILSPDNTSRSSDLTNKTGINLALTTLKIPENWEECLAFLREYLNNVEDTNTFSIDSPLQKIKDEYRNNKEKVKKRRNLKAWKIENDTEIMPNYDDTRRVYHGKSVDIKMYPFLASIHVLGDFVCAGSIISKYYVLTAATCLHIVLNNRMFLKDDPDGIKVRVGSEHTQRSGDVTDVTEIFFHPEYNPVTLNNNLAILKIRIKLKFTPLNRKIRRIEYHKRMRLPDNAREIIMLGWGDKGPEMSIDYDPLTYSYLDIFNHERCVNTYTSKYVNEMHLCAGFRTKGSGACQRDVGGPGIVGRILVGVVSFGPPVCGTPDAPTVFTNIGFYSTWIDSIVKKLPDKHRSQIISNKLSAPEKPHEKPKHSNNKKHIIFKNQSNKLGTKQRSWTEDNNNIIVPKSRYSPAVEFIQGLIQKLIGDGKDIDDMLYKADDNDDEEYDDGIVIDIDDGSSYHEDSEPLKFTTNKPRYPHFPLAKSRTVYSHLNDKTENLWLRTTTKDPGQENTVNFDTGNIMKNFVSGLFQNSFLNTSISPGSMDPISLAIKRLGNYLGISKLAQSKEDYVAESNIDDTEFELRSNKEYSKFRASDKVSEFTKELYGANMPETYQPKKYFTEKHLSTSKKIVQMTPENLYATRSVGIVDRSGEVNIPIIKTARFGVTQLLFADLESSKSLETESHKSDEIEESKSDESIPNVSDNYESESVGMSIETKGTAPKEGTEEVKSLTKRPLGLQAHYDRAEKFLSKNFVLNENIPISESEENSKSDELVVLLVKDVSNPITKWPHTFNVSQNHNEMSGNVTKESKKSFNVDTRFAIISNLENDISNKTGFQNTSAMKKGGSELNTQSSSVEDDNRSSDRSPAVQWVAAVTNVYWKNVNKNAHLPSYSYIPIANITSDSINNSITTAFQTSTIDKPITTNPVLTTDIPNYSNSSSTINTTTMLTDNPVTFDPIALRAVYNASTISKEITMGAYEISEENENVDEEESDTEDGRRILDYINIK